MSLRFRTIKEMKADLVSELESVTLVNSSTLAFDNVVAYQASSFDGISELICDVPAPAAIIAIAGGNFEGNGTQRRGDVEIFISGEYNNRIDIDDRFDAHSLAEAVENHFMINRDESSRFEEFKLSGVNYEVNGMEPIDSDEGFNFVLLELEFMDYRQHRGSLALS